MRNLNGFSKKILLIFSILLLVVPFFFHTEIFAQTDIKATSSFHHTWDGEILNTTIYITLSTNSSPSVVTFYTITIPAEQITPEIFSINRNKELEPTIHRDVNETSLVIDLDKTPISIDKPIVLKITYNTDLTGSSLSLLSSVTDTQTKEFSLTYPSSKGNVSWSSAPITNTEEKGKNIRIDTQSPNSNYVKITFGSDIVYKYEINKTISNLEDEVRLSEVLLPTNNNYQHVLIESITPQQDKAYKDIDGNYILQYSIAPQSSISINIKGYIFMRSSINAQTNQPQLEDISLWRINNTSLIRHLYKSLNNLGLDISDTFTDIKDLQNEKDRELLYEGIYKYVIDNLEPNTQSMGSLSGTERLGGQDILIKQGMATNEDYIDSIISLYRHFNIPARFVIGYITGISNYDSNGIYHYWGEYYDEDKNTWIIVEPFFEDYSKSPLYKTDMKEHVTLIYRSSNPYSPKLNFFSEEDFKIELVNDIPEINNDLKLDLILQPFNLSDPYLVGYISIENKGNTIIDNIEISKSKPDLTKYIDYIDNNSQIILLPNETYDIKFNIPYKDIEDTLFAVVDVLSGTEEIKNSYVEENIEILNDQKNLNTFSKLLSVFLYVLISIPIYFLSKKVKFKNG